jgi:hypothetical protein
MDTERTIKEPRRGRHHRSVPRTALKWGLIAGLLWIAATGFCGEFVSKEYQLKAAFLYNFTKFVEWDPSSFATPGSPIVIGILGSNPYGNELENAVRNRKVNGREVSVRRVQSIAGAKSVHLLFVAATEDARLGELREALKGSGVLTVGESDTFSRSGGIVTFVIDADKVRFDINIAAADFNSVKISAQLQKLARSVRK